MCAIAFGQCLYRPQEFYDLEVNEARLLFKGYSDKLNNEQRMMRKVALIVAEVTNKSFGGSGVYNNVLQAWPIDGDEMEPELTREDTRNILDYHFKELKRKEKEKENG